MAAQSKPFHILHETLPGDFESALRQHGIAPLRRGEVTTLQVNVGRLCNQACHHCHVDAGPKRTEIMSAETAERILILLEATPSVRVLDITGGAPELNSGFRRLVRVARRMGTRVIDRCNLTVLFEPGQEDLARFLAESKVEITASLPCYIAENVDRQRGKGVFDKSIRALQLLNGLGYGNPRMGLTLNLVYNPPGPSLPPAQEALEADYKRQLSERFGIRFDRLLTIANMPIRRFAEALVRDGKLEAYMGLLVNHFNSATVSGLMCRSLVSVGWDGRLYDCDFNQMLEIDVPGCGDIRELSSFSDLSGREIATAAHCFGCTAGSGSSCGGSLQ